MDMKKFLDRYKTFMFKFDLNNFWFVVVTSTIIFLILNFTGKCNIVLNGYLIAFVYFSIMNKYTCNIIFKLEKDIRMKYVNNITSMDLDNRRLQINKTITRLAYHNLYVKLTERYSDNIDIRYLTSRPVLLNNLYGVWYSKCDVVRLVYIIGMLVCITVWR